MEKNKKFIHKSFLPHQYEKEEELLSKMAREGWHFVNLHIGIPTTYEFVKGEPVDYVYQLDYVNKEEDTEDYHSLFADAGWEEVFIWNGLYDGHWYYFRRIRSENGDNRIFTDTESKFLMYDKLWKKYGLFFLLMFSLQINSFRLLTADLAHMRFPSTGSILHLTLYALFVLLGFYYIYMIAGIIMKRNHLKRELDKCL